MQSRYVAPAGSAFLVFVVCVAAVGCLPRDHPRSPEPARLLADVVLEAPLGNGPSDLGALFAEGAQPQVPAAYWITHDGALVVLDTLRGRLMEYRHGKPGRAVPVAGLIEGRSLAVADDGTVFVYDAVGGVIVQVDGEGAVTRHPVPDALETGTHLRLREGADGKIVLAVDEDEYDIGSSPGSSRRGLTFDGHAGRHVVMRVGRDTVVVQVHGRERWRVTADRELLGVTLLGYDATGSLIAEAYDPSAREIVLLAFGPGQVIRLAPVELGQPNAVPDEPLTVGQDGGTYILTFEAGAAVLRRLRWSVPGGPG